MINLLSKAGTIKEFQGPKPLYMFLDLDGTIAPIAKYPHLAKIPAKTGSILRKLAKQKNIKLMITSGRELKDIQKMAGLKNIAYSGSHGLEIAGVPGKPPVIKKYSASLNIIKELARRIKLQTAQIKGIFYEHKRFSFAVHFRLVRGRDIKVLERLLIGIVKQPEQKKLIRIQKGKKVLEILPPFDSNKGNVVDYLLKKHKGFAALYIGDDLTDEHAFRVLAGNTTAVTAVVGKKKRTLAKYYLKDTSEMARLLEKLLRFRGKRG